MNMIEQGILFQITHPNGSKVAVSHPDVDMGFPELLKLFREFAVAAGYHESTVSEHLGHE